MITKGISGDVIFEQSPKWHWEGVNVRKNISCWRNGRYVAPEAGFVEEEQMSSMAKEEGRGEELMKQSLNR